MTLVTRPSNNRTTRAKAHPDFEVPAPLTGPTHVGEEHAGRSMYISRQKFDGEALQAERLLPDPRLRPRRVAYTIVRCSFALLSRRRRRPGEEQSASKSILADCTGQTWERPERIRTPPMSTHEPKVTGLHGSDPQITAVPRPVQRQKGQSTHTK